MFESERLHCRSQRICIHNEFYNMIRSEARFEKRKRVDHRKTQFATAVYKEQDYPHRLSFYDTPPTQEISLEEFETWAIDRLRSKSIILPIDHILMVQFLRNWNLVHFEIDHLKRQLPIWSQC